jgi:HEPN domain-containing protein
MRAEARPWWDQPQADLVAVQALVPGGYYFADSWYSQQTVEKALKAVMFERGNLTPPKVHNLEFLGNSLGVPATVQQDLRLLAPVFGLTRYPSVSGVPPVHLISAQETTDHLDAAQRITAWTATQL